MKKNVILLLFAFIAFAGYGQKRYELKSGRLQMVSQVFGVSQQMTVSFDDYGAIERHDITGEIMGIKTHSLQIRKDGYIYNIDMINKNGTKNRIDDQTAAQNINFTNLSERIISDLQLNKTGTKEYMGKTCDVWEMNHKEASMKGTYYVWQGISVKTDMVAAGMTINMWTEEIETDVNFEPDFFEIPTGITLR